MAGEKKYLGVPADSTGGKRVRMVPTYEITYVNKVDPTYTWKIGQLYVIKDNGVNQFMVHLHGVVEDGTGGKISVHLSEEDCYLNREPETGQNIYDPDGVTLVATMSASEDDKYDVYIPGYNLVGFDNPEYGQDVDITGSANVRFAEGLPQLDAWGKLRTSGAVQLGDYVFGQEEVFIDNFSPVRLAGGYADYSNTRHSIKIGVDYTVDAANGFASSSTNSYHHYIAGSSHLYAGTSLLNSPASTSYIRQWGLFDANNGFLFRLGTGGINAVDATGLSVVVRSNIPEAPQKDTIITRADWNGDKLDGSGDSGAVLDLEKVNLWWIDIQWHGAGRVRFGTYIDGQRVVCHSYYHGNVYSQAMSQSASLPCCYSVKSFAGATTELYIESWSAAVWTESDVDLRAYGSPALYASNHNTVTADIADDWQFLFALSPRELHSNGEINHTLYQPTSVSAFSLDTAALNGIDAVVDLKMEVNSIHAGHAFTSVTGSNVDVSTAGTSYEAGKVILQDMFKGRYDNVLTDTFNNFQYGSVKNFPDDGGTVENGIGAIDAGGILTTTERIWLREPQTATFPFNAGGYVIEGTSEAAWNGQTVYASPTGVNTAQLYTDELLTTPATFGVSAGGTISGFQGSRVIWSFYAKTRTALHTAVQLMIIMKWKEIIQ